MNQLKNIALKPVVWLVAGTICGATAIIALTCHPGAVVSEQLKQSPSALARNTEDSSVSNAMGSMDVLKAVDRSYTELVKKVSPAVVFIRSGAAAEDAEGSNDSRAQRQRGRRFHPFFGGNVPQGGQGSGVIIRSDGWIVTNDHVVDGFDKVKVTLSDGRELDGTVRHANDATVDVAVIKIEAKDLPYLAFSDSSKVQLGQSVLIVGSPLGLENSVSFGKIGGLNRQNFAGSPTDPSATRFYSNVLQVDGSIHPGNSGGPLVDILGMIIGINSSKISLADGIGFAIKSNLVKVVSDKLIKDGKITRSFLGLNPEDLKEYEKKKLGIDFGVRVSSIEKEGPADRAGLKDGDIVIKMDGVPIETQQDLRIQMFNHPPGSTIDFSIIRDKQAKNLKVTCEPLPNYLAQRGSNRVPKGSERPRMGERYYYEGPEEGNEGPGLDPFEQFFGPGFRYFFGSPYGGGGSQYYNAPRGRGHGQYRGNDESREESAPRPGKKVSLGATVTDLSSYLKEKHFIPQDRSGAMITRVHEGSLAEKIGLKPGDVIHGIGNVEILNKNDLAKVMESLRAGDKRSLTYSRYSKDAQMSFTVTVVF